MMARLSLLLTALLSPAAAAAGEREVVLRLGAESDSNPTRVFGAGEGLEVGPKGTVSYRDQLLLWPDGLLTTENQLGTRWLPLRNDWAAVWQVGGGLTWMGRGDWTHRAQAEFRGRSEAVEEDDLGISRDYERLAGSVGSSGSWGEFSVEGTAGYAAFGYAADRAKSWHGPTLTLSGSYAPTEALLVSMAYEPSLRRNEAAAFSLSESLSQSASARVEYDGGRWIASAAGAATAAASSISEPGSGAYLHRSLELTVGGLLWGDALGRLSGVLQRVDYDGVGSVVELAVEDEDRNQVSLAIEQPLSGGWGLEGRYQRLLQRQQAGSSAQNDFERHIAFVGLSWRSGAGGEAP